MHKRSLNGEEVKEALGSGRYLAIALVDKIKLGLGGYCAAAALWGGPDAAAAYLHAGEPAYVGAVPEHSDNRFWPTCVKRQSSCGAGPTPPLPTCMPASPPMLVCSSCVIEW